MHGATTASACTSLPGSIPDLTRENLAQEGRKCLPIGVVVASQGEPPHARAREPGGAARGAGGRPYPPFRPRRACRAGARTPSPGRRRPPPRPRETAARPRPVAAAAPARPRAPASGGRSRCGAAAAASVSIRSAKVSRSSTSLGWNSIRSIRRTPSSGRSSASVAFTPIRSGNGCSMPAAIEQRRVLGEDPDAARREARAGPACSCRRRRAASPPRLPAGRTAASACRRGRPRASRCSPTRDSRYR